jgi:ABC-2 type transport system ATP-binding protein
MSLVHARNLGKSFNGKQALENINLDIVKGRITGLVGCDGSGKTTLMRLLSGLLLPDSGTLEVLGLPLPENAQNIQMSIGYMPQKFGLYEDLTVEENLHLYAELQSIDPGKQTERINELLHFTSLGEFKTFMAGQLSGGMKQKLGLACALIKKPALLLLDEPGVGVDPISRRELWSMVKVLIEEGVGIIYSTAYLDEAEKCDEVILLNEGKILYSGNPKALSDSMKGKVFRIEGKIKDKRRTLQLALGYDAVKDGVILGNSIKLICESESALPTLESIEAKGSRYKAVLPNFEDGFIHILHGNFNGRSLLAEQMKVSEVKEGALIEAIQLSKKFGTFTAASNVNFKIRQGEIFGFLGPNGAGKSTIFKMLCGLLTPTSGEAKVLGMKLERSSSSARKKIGYMSQKFSLYGDISVIENLRFFAGAYGLKGKEKKKKIEDMLDIFGLKAYEHLQSKELALGFKQRLSLACAVMHDPVVLFLDEPTSGVDPLTRREFWNHIYAMVQKGMTIMVTTHFMEEAEYCDRIALIYKSHIIALGTPHELIAQVSDEATMEDAFVALIQRSDDAEV